MRADPSERMRLRHWCAMLAAAATVLALANTAAAAVFNDASSLAIAAEMFGYAALSLAGLGLTERGHGRAVVVLQVVGLLVIAVTTTITHPDLPATPALAVLLAGIVAFLFADRRALAPLLILTWTSGLLATLLALLPSPPVLRPAAFDAVLSISSVSAATALILWLLWQSRSRAQSLLHEVTRHERRIQLMVDSALDANIVVGSDGTIRSWNPRAEEVLGWSSEEAVGASVAEKIVPQSGRADFAQSFRDATAVTDAAHPIHLRREALARHRDGHEVPVEISISRFESEGETLLSASLRDLSAQRATEAHLDREIQERGAVARSVGRIRSGATAEQTAASICRGISESLNLEVAAIYQLIGTNQALPLALRVPRGAPVSRSRPLPTVRAAHLIRRAKSGPWIDRWHARSEDGAYGRTWTDIGLSAVAYVPFRGTDGLLGLMIAGTMAPAAGADDMARHLPSLVQYAVLAGALLGPQLRGRRDRQAKREQIERVIEKASFRSVFQPIVDLATGSVVGYEALTRFDDHVRPDLRLAEAETAGLGLELETATMAAALEAAHALPAGPWISVNASPRMVLNGDCLRGMLQNTPRKVVVEITEQSQIADYAAVRTAIAEIGDHVRLAVDDAGAGFASLRHIIELRPNVVKLDIGLIHGIHADSARQALVAGMVHFAQRAACDLIAEGVEEEADLRTLRGLGIRLGQGYLLGRPALARTFHEVGPSLVRPPEPAGVWNWSPMEPVDLRGMPIKN